MPFKQTISAPPDKACTVVIVEPAMDTDQPSMKELDRFELEAGETREYDMPTGTAGYRQEDAGAPRPVSDPSTELNPEPTPNQEPREGFAPGVEEEISVGQERQQEVASAQESAQQEKDPDKKGSLPATQKESEEKEGGEAQVSSAGTPQDNVSPDTKHSTPTTNTEDTSGSPKKPGRPRKS
jgi:hypothetical protein